MSLVTELERLADALGDTSAEAPPPIAWTSVAERIARNLNVKPEEVGILGLSMKWRHLYFLFPETLRNVGFIPLTSNSALAARTVRERRSTRFSSRGAGSRSSPARQLLSGSRERAHGNSPQRCARSANVAA